MFHHLDSALRSLLLSAMPGDTAISFDTPTQSWAGQKRTAPTLNVFLHQVRDDAKARLGGWVDRRDATGRVVAREQAPREYRSCYLLTAWAADVGQEHSLLGAAVAILAANEMIQPPHLPEPLVVTGFPVTVSVADPALPCAGTDIWSALDIPPRCGLDLVVTTSIVPSVVTALTPAPRRIELGVADTVPTAAAEPPSVTPETQVRERPAQGRPGTRGSGRATRTKG